MKTGKQISSEKAFMTLLPAMALSAVILSGILKHIELIEITKVGLLTLILTAASVFYIRAQEEEILKKKLTKSIITLSYLLSITFIMLPINPDIYCFWMSGGFIVAMLVDSKLGLLVYINLTFILSITCTLRPETTIQFLIIGVMMCLLAGALKKKATVVYASIILLSTNITLSFVINNFIFETSSNYNYLNTFFSISIVIAAAFLLTQLYEKIQLKHGKEEELPEASTEDTVNPATNADDEMPSSAAAATEEPETSVMYDMGARTSYELLTEDGNELIQKMKSFSEELYEHSRQIGDLSARAAELIGADELLARAGGLYHEIGKMNGKNYIEEGLKIAEEYAFTNELKAILRQHNIKFEKPTSVEAAIVMLSDNVVSTIEYIRKTEEKKYTMDKIIENIFQLRMEKGTFDESGLSVKDYKRLKEFYQNEYKK